MKLYIGNQNYSSWSLRPWLMFATYQLEVEVIKLPLYTDEFYTRLAKVTPAAKVPALVDGELKVWDSLAILEYVNEKYLGGRAWPKDVHLRAKARALAAEMHSGFVHLRDEFTMNCRARVRLQGSDQANKDIARIDAIWSEQMAAYPEAWLFGEWSIADAMYAPVALRAETYGFALSEGARAYQQKVLASPPVQSWLQQASEETEVLELNEVGEPV